MHATVIAVDFLSSERIVRRLMKYVAQQINFLAQTNRARNAHGVRTCRVLATVAGKATRYSESNLL